MCASSQRIYEISIGSVPSVEKTMEFLAVASVEIGLEVNADKTKYTFMSHDHNAGPCHNIKIDNCSLERVEEFKYLGKNLTNQNSIEEEIKKRMKSGNACCYSLQNRMPSI
jgi:hypothetical protein